jgi:hypothetical protein
MTDPLSSEELEKIRERSRPAAAYASLDALTASADDVPALLAEVDRLHSWEGLMSLLDEHWPEDIFPTVEDSGDRDWGPRIVSLLRWVDRLRTEATQREELLAKVAFEAARDGQQAGNLAAELPLLGEQGTEYGLRVITTRGLTYYHGPYDNREEPEAALADASLGWDQRVVQRPRWHGEWTEVTSE